MFKAEREANLFELTHMRCSDRNQNALILHSSCITKIICVDAARFSLICCIVPQLIRPIAILGLCEENTVNGLIMSPLYRGGDILLYLSPLSCSSDQFCVCAFSPSIEQAVKHETLTQYRTIVGPPYTTLSQH